MDYDSNLGNLDLDFDESKSKIQIKTWNKLKLLGQLNVHSFEDAWSCSLSCCVPNTYTSLLIPSYGNNAGVYRSFYFFRQTNWTHFNEALVPELLLSLFRRWAPSKPVVMWRVYSKSEHTKCIKAKDTTGSPKEEHIGVFYTQWRNKNIPNVYIRPPCGRWTSIPFSPFLQVLPHHRHV